MPAFVASHVTSRIKLYGERNSGTNYLERLIRLNLAVHLLRGTTPDPVDVPFFGAEWVRDLYFRLAFRSNLGWKHMLAPDVRQLEGAVDPGLLFVCLVKNPYAWLLSLYRKPHHARERHASFEAFLVNPWHTLGRENAPKGFPNPIALWNAKMASYLQLSEHQRVVVLRYEDLLADPLGVLDSLCREHGIPVRKRPLENIVNSVHDSSKGWDYEFYRSYYLEERWREKLSPAALQIIDRELDATLVQRLGYARVAAAAP